MRIGEWNIDSTELQRMCKLAPIGRDHVRGSRQTRGAAKLRHDLSAGETSFGATGVFGIGEHPVHALAQPDGLFQRPATVWIERHAGIRKAFSDSGDNLYFVFAAQHTAL